MFLYCTFRLRLHCYATLLPKVTVLHQTVNVLYSHGLLHESNYFYIAQSGYLCKYALVIVCHVTFVAVVVLKLTNTIKTEGPAPWATFYTHHTRSRGDFGETFVTNKRFTVHFSGFFNYILCEFKKEKKEHDEY